VVLATFANGNFFGIYVNITGNSVELFAGSNGSGDSVTLQMTGAVEVYVNGSTTGTNFAGNAFAFYLDSSGQFLDANGNGVLDSGEGFGGLFYSDTDLNRDGMDHMAAYAGDGTDDVCGCSIDGRTFCSWSAHPGLGRPRCWRLD